MNENHSIVTVKFKGNDVFFALGLIFAFGVIIMVSSQNPVFGLPAEVTPENLLCKNDMQLILKINKNKPLCVTPETAEKLIQRDNFSNLKTYFVTYEVYHGLTGPLVCDSGDFAISGGFKGGTSDIANMRILDQLPDRVQFEASDKDDGIALFLYAYCGDIAEPFR